MKKNVSEILLKKSKARNRERSIDMGAYDGRFGTRVVSDKKKNLYKTYRKNKHNIYR